MADKTYREKIIEHMNSMPMAELGDPSKTYDVVLTEPEINSIHAAMAFIRSASAASGLTAFWTHYGPTLQALSDRLGKFDDGQGEPIQ